MRINRNAGLGFLSNAGSTIRWSISGVALHLMVSSYQLAFAEPSRETEIRRATEEQIAADLANPLAPITTLALQYRSEFGNGPDDEVNHQLRLQPSFFKPFHDTSAFLLRTALPIRFTAFPDETAGLGDLSLSPYYVPDLTSSTFFGVGGTVTLPSATEDSLGSKKWSVGPALVVAEIGDPIVFGALIQHLWSYAGTDDRSDVNVFTAQPFVTYLLGSGFSATVNSETNYDFRGSAGSRWVIPIASAVSKVVELGGEFFNIGLAYVTYVERPTQAADAEFRLNLTYVVK